MYINCRQISDIHGGKKVKVSKYIHTHTLVCSMSIIGGGRKVGGSTVAHKMSGGAHKKPCTHIITDISELFAKKSRTQTPVKKSNVFIINAADFISLPWFWPLTLPNTVKLNYYFCLSASSIQTFKLPLCMYVHMYVQVQRSYFKAVL